MRKTTERRKRKIRILVVDGNASIRKLYREEFREEGYEVLSARTGREAMQRLNESDPDLVMLEIMLRDVDGERLLHQIREQWPTLPIIVSTASDVPHIRKFSGVDACLMKSSDTAALKQTVRNVLLRSPLTPDPPVAIVRRNGS